MKYLILAYATQEFFDGVSDGAEAEMGEAMTRLNDDLKRGGEFIAAVGLEAPAHTRRVELREGVPVVTDGPYAETQEVLAGYWMVECDGFDRATEIGARLAALPGERSVVDIRPVMGIAD